MKSTTYYGMSCNPFDKQQVREKDCFRSNDFVQMTSRLDYLKDIRGIGVFTAMPGMGKSFALRCFADSLNRNLYHMEYICLSTVSVSEFYKEVCGCLGVNDKGGLGDQEVAAYISHKLRISGASESIISEAALSAVHSYAQGNPRMIDNLMTDALTLGAQNGNPFYLH